MQLHQKNQKHYSLFLPNQSMKIPDLISIVVYTSLLITTTLSFKDGNETDLSALLAFKAEITQNPLETLSSWNDSLHFCKWRGVTCGRNHRRVTMLDLHSEKLVGSICPYIGNLTFLKVLDLSNNSFIGEIPVEIGSLSNLRGLSLDKNNLSGRIPSSLGNLSSLSTLYLSYNNLVGTIPEDIGQLASLNIIDLSYNNLSGMIPPSLYNLSLARFFSLNQNRLLGSLPFNIGHTLPNLIFFSISFNKLFTGVIPASFSNCSSLEVLELSGNNLAGSVPINFGKLENLFVLNLSENNLGSGDEADDDLKFLTSLTNCSNLSALYINNNNFGGMLPGSVGNFSTKLKELLLGSNKIYGSIPAGIQNLVGLTRLALEDNLFTGTIPVGFGKLQNLGVLSLYRNKLTGQIPSSLGSLTRLNSLFLGDNKLSGRIPSSLGNCRYLAILDLSVNMLNGTIPKQVIGLSSLSIQLDLGNNSLSGSLPLEVGNLINLGSLGLYDNKLTGEIPSSLSKCVSLRTLLLEGNLFKGNIPPSLSSLKGLEILSLSRNNLSGLIPKDLEKLSTLRRLNLSSNNLEGDVPREGVFKNISGISVVGNSKLCGGISQLHLPECPNKVFKKHKKSLSFKVIVLIVVGIVLLMFIVSSTLIFCWIKKSKRKPSATSKFGDRSLEMVSYNEILKATDEFSSSNLLGVGSFGYVYKAIFHEDQKPVAVKVLKLQQSGANKSFMAECDALRNVRHRNLLKIITSCSSIDFQGNDFKALIFEFMPNGNLESWLHPSNADIDHLPWRSLSFEQRLNIAIDVASALDYLHHHCGTPIVHCDLKPSNVLLDNDLIAHVSDFGLAKFLLQSSTDSVQNEQNSSAAIKGSIGYVAPEYGMGSIVSTRGDVYSYGILLLELLTGKRPTADIFKDGINLHSFSKMALLSDQILEIVDARLFLEGGDDDEATNATMENVRDTEKEKMRGCLISMMRIGILCSEELPADRMDMGNVFVELHVVKDMFLALECTVISEIRHISR